jgi:uncharacterized protein (TIGR02466 family)
MTINQIFYTPIKCQQFEIDNKALSEFCYDVQKTDTGTKKSNSGNAWQSNSLNIVNNLEKNEIFKLLVSNISACGKVFAQELGIVPSVGIQNMWINISKPGGYNINHVHPKSILSGCFYVKTPENCGSIVFTNPIRDLMCAYMDYWHLMDEGKLNNSPFSHMEWEISPKENDIVLFPSWLAHHVNDNKSNEDRISISFNFATLNIEAIK